MPNAKKVKIKNIEGEIVEMFGNRMLRFFADNLEVTISGKLGEEDIVRVAESMV